MENIDRNSLKQQLEVLSNYITPILDKIKFQQEQISALKKENKELLDTIEQNKTKSQEGIRFVDDNFEKDLDKHIATVNQCITYLEKQI